MEELHLLQKKITALLKQHAAMEADYAAMQKTIAQQHSVIQAHQEKIEALQKELQWNAVTQASSVLDPEKKAYLKQQLDKVLKELEKNIDLLK